MGSLEALLERSWGAGRPARGVPASLTGTAQDLAGVLFVRGPPGAAPRARTRSTYSKPVTADLSTPLARWVGDFSIAQWFCSWSCSVFGVLLTPPEAIRGPPLGSPRMSRRGAGPNYSLPSARRSHFGSSFACTRLLEPNLRNLLSLSLLGWWRPGGHHGPCTWWRQCSRAYPPRVPP